MPKVLITDACHALLPEGLSAAGYEIHYRPDISYADTLDCIGDYAGIVINSKIFVNRDFLDRATKLRFVARLGSGLEIIDQPYAQQKGVAILNSPDGNCDAVAEQAMAMLLALLTNLRRADSEVRQFTWRREENRGTELMHKTVGIVGFGYTGSAFARRLQGFACRVLAYDKYKKDYAADFPHVAECADMQPLFDQCDIVSLHLPLTAETTHLANAAWIASFQKNILLLNTARGQIIPTADLVEALHSGKIRAAGIDVFENEKPQTFSPDEKLLYSQLYANSHVILTPHIAGWTQESKHRLAHILLQKILALP